MANIFDQFDNQQAQENVFDQFDPDVTTDIAKGFSSGANTGIDATLNMIGAITRVPVNMASQALGYGEVLPELQAARRFNVAGGGEGAAGRVAEAVGEVAGGSLLPSAGLAAAGRAAGPTATGILGKYARTPGREAGIDAVSTLGAGSGVAAAREGDLGPVGEIGLGLLGGFALPNAANMGKRAYEGAKSGAEYANRQIARARDPEMAAYQDVADQSTKAGLDLQGVRNSVAPQPSANLRGRNTPAGTPFSSDDMADIVSRRIQGEPAADIAADYGLHSTTVQRYVDNYQEANPTPRNLVDIAKSELETGGAAPLTNQARADAAISDDPESIKRLMSRQREQPGRTADIIEQSQIGGRNLDEQLDFLKTTGKQEENAAYGLVRQNAKPVSIGGVISNARAAAAQRGGEIGRKLNEAIDLFFQPELRQKPRSPQAELRLTEAEERLQEAISRKASSDTINRLRRRVRVMREQDEFSRPLKDTKVGTPVDDVGRFIDARQELSQMTKRSMQDGKATPLTAELTQLRKELNRAARQSNPDLTKADAKFSGNRDIENLARQGEKIGKKLTSQTRRALREFKSLTPTQQEIQRVAFESELASQALGVRRGNAAADQFNTEAFDKIIATMYPKSAGKEVFERGQKMLRDLKGEAISTETNRDILAGSRTAPLQDDMAELLEGPRAAADLMTGRFGKVFENLSNRLTRMIGEKAAQERLRILTETDPAKMLPMLVRLAKEAKNSSERNAYNAAIREWRNEGRRRATEIGVTAIQTDQE